MVRDVCAWLKGVVAFCVSIPAHAVFCVTTPVSGSDDTVEYVFLLRHGRLCSRKWRPDCDREIMENVFQKPTMQIKIEMNVSVRKRTVRTAKCAVIKCHWNADVSS